MRHVRAYLVEVKLAVTSSREDLSIVKGFSDALCERLRDYGWRIATQTHHTTCPADFWVFPPRIASKRVRGSRRLGRMSDV